EPLAVPVVEVRTPPDHVVQRLVMAAPDANLVAVGIFDDAELVLVGEKGDAGGVVARVVGPVRAVRTYREADDIARFPRLFAVRRPTRWRPGNDDQPLLVAPVEVIRANRLSRRQVIDGHREARRSEPWRELRGLRAESGRITLVADCLVAKEI